MATRKKTAAAAAPAPVAAVTQPATLPLQPVAKAAAKVAAAPAAAAATGIPAGKAAKATKATKAGKADKPEKAVKDEKARKPKLVRDSYTIPKAEHAVLQALKDRAARAGRPAKKSELLRAGIQALAGMTDAAFLACVGSVEAIKTGRPAKPAS